jgi:hypothetical protein
MRIVKPRLDAKAAELLAIEALHFLGEDFDRLGRFLALSGVDPGDIRRLARERSFLCAVLAHLADDERLLMSFSEHSSRNPAEINEARRLLAGPDWERDTA